MGCSPWGRKESDTTEQLTHTEEKLVWSGVCNGKFSFSFAVISKLEKS